MRPVHVLGGGLAGTEAAWQIARAGLPVALHEMRPRHGTPAHHTGDLGELVCSNSFGTREPDRAAGLLQAELRRLGSFVLAVADRHRVPAGGALAVDRTAFSRALTRALEEHPLVEVRRERVEELPAPETVAVLATGPLTATPLAEALRAFTGRDYLRFYDAASPIVTGESLDARRLFRASRYGRGEAAYLNAPLGREAYLRLREALVTAARAPLKDFEREDPRFFEACLPIEELARRGVDTLRFGPLRPTGLRPPDGSRPYAVVQLRPEDREGRLWNLVGFQTNLKWGEQARVFRLIPGLERAEFVRFGVMHRNTYLRAPELLRPTLQFRRRPSLLAAGQITGTEGYLAAVAGGWLAGTNAARLARGLEPVVPPRTCLLGALVHFVARASPHDFQPMPPTLGVLPPLPRPIRGKRQRREALAQRALAELEEWCARIPVAWGPRP